MELSVGETQYVAFSVKDDIAADKPVSLHYRNLIDGAEYVSTASNIVDGSALFELRFSTGASGTYQLTDVFYSTKTGSDYHMDLLALSETSTFIVAEEHSSQMRSLDASEEGSGIEVYGIDDDGDLVKSDGLFGTLSAKARASRANGRNLIVVIDPGHGGYDPGTVAGGLVESNLNLKIAQYCAQELRTYWGVEVYMTRESDVFVDLDERADFAKEKNADFFISIHINSGGGKGAEVWIPAINESWYPSYHEIGKEVANKILSSLKSLGLSNRGTKFDYYTINGGKFYPDGSRADSLAVIRYCREYGIPAILVEHGFIDNETDASILASESKLKSMGVSEAKAVAEYLQLSKEKKPCPSVTWMRNNEIDLVWDAIPGATRYAIAMKTGSGYKTFTYDCTSTSYTVTGLTDTKTYQFLVQAYVNGRWTTFTDRDLLTCTLIPMPEARVASTGDGTVTLEWDGVGGAERYAVAEYVGGRYVTFTYDCGGTSYTATDLANGYEHSFLVQAYVGGRWSSFGPANHVKATPEGTVKPSVEASPADRSVTLSWGRVPGATRYAVAVRQGAGWRTLTYDCLGTSYVASGLSNGTEYEFLVQAYCMGRWSAYSDSDAVKATTPGTPIMGSSQTTVDRMVILFNSTGKTYPSDVYASRGASTIEDFCRLVVEESASEGVRAEVVFAQAMLETGWLQFGCDVKPEQCNFCGLGATGGGEGGATFSSVREGIRAQVQHLKAYASTDPLNNPCVDPRFQYVTRGVAPTLEELNGRWAMSNTYGQSIAAIVEKMLQGADS